MNNFSKIAVFTHNPKGKWGDVRPIIENGYYKGWGKSINVELGQTVLIYISGDTRQIKYVMKVTRVSDKDIDMKLIKKLTDKESALLSFDKLKENGLKNGTINYILDNNKQLYGYIKNILHLNDTNKREVGSKMAMIKNIILYGSPGVGKTHNTNKLIRLIEDGKSDKEIFGTIQTNAHSENIDISDIKERVKFVTFHQSFGYEDFIEGFRPNKEGRIELEDGIFKIMCDDANNDRKNNFYLIIDEINRGNISKIFGELITLIEEDKRNTLEVTLPYSKKPFKIPSNLYIIGTMNSTDKSIALIDIALRRRFTFLKMEPNAELIKYQNARNIFETINEKIRETLGDDYQIGHSYFMPIESDEDLAFVLQYKIIPLLEEYYYGDKNGLEEVEEIVLPYFQA